MQIYLTQGLHRAVQQQPQAIAVHDGGQARTFAQLLDRVARLAGVLRQFGVSRGDRVAMLAANGSAWMDYYFGTWWSGAVVNPVNVRWSAAEIAYSLADCDTRVLMVGAEFAPLVPALRARVPQLQHVIAVDSGCAGDLPLLDELLERAEPQADACGTGDTLAAIFYTGGTTGTPKGVMLSHANLWSSAISRMAQVPSKASSVALHVAPLFHLASAGRLVSQVMLGGASVMLPSFRPAAVVEAIERHRVSEVTLVPSMIRMLLDDAAFDPRRLASLERMSYGASPIPESLLDRALERLPGVEFSQAYGQTEASPIITINPPESHVGEGRSSGRLAAAGRASWCCEVRIVDAGGAEVPRGEVGEIVARGPNVMLGYWNKPQETAAALRDGWLHTGDAGRMDEAGYVYVVDRLKDMIVSGGENVYSAEVELAAGSHPAVAACAAIGVPSERWGEAVHIVVVLKPGTSLTLEDLQAHCRERIAGYKCPRSMEVRDALPLSAVGKVLKSELRKAHWAGHPRAVG
jgi:long-chain acyl-CoA synthetase